MKSQTQIKWHRKPKLAWNYSDINMLSVNAKDDLINPKGIYSTRNRGNIQAK